jgi:hypothetical protein
VKALLVTLATVATAVALSACGGSSGLIPQSDASRLQTDLNQVSDAVVLGDCDLTGTELDRTRADLDSLPQSVDASLVANLRQGLAALDTSARRDCHSQSATGPTGATSSTGPTGATSTTGQTGTTSSTSSTSSTSTSTTTSTTTATTTTTSAATTTSSAATSTALSGASGATQAPTTGAGGGTQAGGGSTSGTGSTAPSGIGGSGGVSSGD